MTLIKLMAGLGLLGYALLAQSAGVPAEGAEKAAACGGCHGDDGNGAAPIFPKLAGQHPSYLIKQLANFKDQSRVEPTMNAMASALTEDDMEDIAAFYATRKMTFETGKPNALGESIYRAGNPATGVPACTGCHNPDGVGNPQAKFPQLRGQYAEYIEKTLHDFKAGERANDMNAMMRVVAAKLSEEEMNAVADYIATFK
ncbi:MAG: c-type cytochrome [Methylococcus sp.]